MKKIYRYGFSIIEILIVLAIVGLLAAVAQPGYQLLRAQLNSRDMAITFVQILRRSQTLAIAGSGDSNWGVYIASSSLVLYKGSSYATRTSSFDEVYPTIASFSVQGQQELNFTKQTGLPNTSGTTTLTTIGAAPRVLYINAKGTISY